jgi:hypothetical protein
MVFTRENEESAQNIIVNEIENVQNNPLIIKNNGCAACYVLFAISSRLKISEQDASDLLSEVLYENPDINNSFIEMVETIHFKRRMMGTAFAMKTREAKDNYLNSNFKNTLEEVHSDIINYGINIVIRKLLLSFISLEIAKNLGIDYHASTEELYYFMRKNDKHTQLLISNLMDRFFKSNK